MNRYLLYLLASLSVVVALVLAASGPGSAVSESPSLPPDFEQVTMNLPHIDVASAFATWRASQDGRAVAQTVFPPDARRLVTATTAPGWRTIARLVMFDRAVAIEGECSGVFLNYNVI